MSVNHAKEYFIFVHISVVFLHFPATAFNGCQYSNFGNKCPKLGTGTPEDMILTNLGDNLDSDPSGFVLVYSVTSFTNKHTYEILIITIMPDSFKVPWIKSFSALDLHRHFRTSVHARTHPTFAAVVLPSLQLTITLTLAVQKSGLIPATWWCVGTRLTQWRQFGSVV